MKKGRGHSLEMTREDNLPGSALIGGAGKIPDMIWIGKVFGSVISVES
jgi:hypothetical protein